MVLADIFGEQGIIVLLVIVAVLFAGPQIPKLARSLGSAKGEFEKGLAEGKDAEGKDTANKDAEGKDTANKDAGGKDTTDDKA